VAGGLSTVVGGPPTVDELNNYRHRLSSRIVDAEPSSKHYQSFSRQISIIILIISSSSSSSSKRWGRKISVELVVMSCMFTEYKVRMADSARAATDFRQMQHAGPNWTSTTEVNRYAERLTYLLTRQLR